MTVKDDRGKSQTFTLGERGALASSYASDHRDPITELFLVTLNDSIDASGERMAAGENRIPGEAWWLLLFVGAMAMMLIGLDVRPSSAILRLTLPLVLSGSVALIMDLDSPREGLISIDQPSFDRLAQEVANTLPQQTQ